MRGIIKDKRNNWNRVGIILVLLFFLKGVCVLTGAFSITAMAASSHTGDIVVVEPPKPVEIEISTGPTGARNYLSLKNTSRYGKYYSYLSSDDERIMYDVIVGAVNNYAPYGSNPQELVQGSDYFYKARVTEEFYNELIETCSNYNAFRTAFNRANEAAQYDNVDKIEFTMCCVYFYFMKTPTNEFYLGSCAVASTTDDYKAMDQTLKNARAKFLSNIAATSEAPVNELVIHDALLDQVTYDVDGYSSGQGQHLCHTAYGALVKGLAVCDGYSMALQYLLDYKKIDSVIVTGEANGGGHAWNRVKLGSDWYEVDATWDDDEKKRDDNKRHMYFNKTKMDDHKTEEVYLGYLMGSTTAFGTEYTYENIKKIYSEVQMTGITASESSLSMIPGQYEEVEIKISPADTTDRNVKWQTSDSNVAVVEDGRIKAVDYGTVQILVVSNSNPAIKTTIAVNVAETEAFKDQSKADTDSEATTAKETGSELNISTGSSGGTYVVVAGEEPSVVYKKANDNKVKNIIVPESVTDENGLVYKVTEIAPGAFKGCKNLRKVTISASVVKIGKDAFKNCKKLKSIVIKGNLKKVSSGAFKNLPKNAKVTVYAASGKLYNSIVRKLKRAGATNAIFRRKKS
ncbi:leucine-rich repeat protein [Butyrivibrio sp. JL13D10]|uniref:leucine-rich repeat protein n=1 Tax=Butyrivibrio sp. JL13D10 TaxID=3236815 RepID=UPI0038B43208